MPTSDFIKRLLTLDHWFNTETGQLVAQYLHQEILLATTHKGDIALQIGNCGEEQFLTHLEYNHKWILAPNLSSFSNIIASLDKIPFSNHSVDCVIAPFITEICNDEVYILEEIDRVLKPGGHLIIIGINPISFWGVWSKLSKNNCFGMAHIKLRSIFSLKHLLYQWGYQQSYYSNFYFLPPSSHIDMLRKFKFINDIGKILAPWPPNLYCYAVKKSFDNRYLSAIPLTSSFNLKSFNTPVCSRSQFRQRYGKILNL